MMAVFSPKTQSIAFEPPESVPIEVIGAGNLTEITQVQIWSNTMMKWRGECFLTAGLWVNNFLKGRFVFLKYPLPVYRSRCLPFCHLAWHYFPSVGFSFFVVERVRLHSNQFGMVVSNIFLCPRPLLRVALHQRPKLWHPVLFSSTT